jgi:FkbM family methyltransferase
MIEKFPFGINLKAFLDSNNTYRRWKFSEFGLWLWRKISPAQSDVIHREDLYFKLLLQPLRSRKPPIFDIGANVGWVSKTFVRFTDKVVALEPDGFCQQILKNRFEKSKVFLLVPKAVSDTEGVKEFLIQEEGSALNTFSEKWRKELEADFFYKPFLFTAEKIKVRTTTFEQLIKEHGLPSLAKVDVEGHELEVIKGLHQPIPLLVFEANLPVFLEETAKIIDMLKVIDGGVVFNYSLKFEMMLPEYLTPTLFLETLEAAGKCSIDVICRMSNYHEYYLPD